MESKTILTWSFRDGACLCVGDIIIVSKQRPSFIYEVVIVYITLIPYLSVKALVAAGIPVEVVDEGYIYIATILHLIVYCMCWSRTIS